MTEVYRGRFAPSPSGSLHFGSLVAAMGSYLDARSRGGTWLLRIEDLDPPRERPGAAEGIIRTLDAFGFQWDESIVYQSQRIPAYLEALSKLSDLGCTFPCSCTRKEINSAGLVGQDGPVYPGFCRDGGYDRSAAHAIRLKVPDRIIEFRDLVCGVINQRLSRDCGDFVIQRRDGFIAYQLAVVVDDAWQGITSVVRGADLLMSTPRQIFLHNLLDLPVPYYAHLPLVTDRRGLKLSKQSQSRPVTLDDPLPALLSAWSFLGQSPPQDVPDKVEAFWDWAIRYWDIKKVPYQSVAG